MGMSSSLLRGASMNLIAPVRKRRRRLLMLLLGALDMPRR